MKLFKTLLNRTPLGWLQLWHNKPRMTVAVVGIAFADVLIFMQLGFQQALFNSNLKFQREFNADIILVSPEANELNRSYTFTRRRLLQAQDIPGVQSATPVYLNTVEWQNPDGKNSFLVFGHNPEQPIFKVPEINQQLPKLKRPDQVLFDRAARGDNSALLAQIEQGEFISRETENKTVTVAGTYQVGASFAVDGSLVVSTETFLKLFPRRQAGVVSLGLLKVESGQDVQAVSDAINRYFESLNIQDVKAYTHEAYVQHSLDYLQTVTPIGFVFGFGSAMGFIVGLVIVYQILSTDVNDHLAEYATFKAMGYGDRYLLGVISEEAVILAFLGFLPGLGVSIGLYTLAASATALPITMSSARAIGVLILTIAMCGVSGAITARQLQGADPADIF